MTSSPPKAEDEAHDELGRKHLPVEKRIELLERDRAQQSRMITELITTVQKGFTPEQITQIKTAFREEIAGAGLRLDGADHQDEARRDFMFLRSLRRGVNGAAAKIGWLVIAAAVGAIMWLVNSGLSMWRSG